MSTVNLGPSEPPVSDRVARTGTEVQLRVEDVLASSRRLWLRGRLTSQNTPRTDTGWYRLWWTGSGKAAPPQTAHLETRVSGSLLETDVSLLPDGRFEALLDANLPPARRGWRVARHKLTCAGVTAEGCGIVLVPPVDAVGAVVVVLPLPCTFDDGAIETLERLDYASQLGGLLHRLSQGPEGCRPIYYLGCVPANADGRQRELALALTALGWPVGNVVLMPAAAADPAALAEGLDRLRWLFAGSLDLQVINLEPTAADLLQTQAQPKEDRASVLRLVRPEDAPWSEPAGRNGTHVVGLRPTRSSRVTRYPVVFCHGMLAFSTIKMQMPDELNSFASLRGFLRERGYRALFPQVAPTSGIVARAGQLREQILRWTEEPVNLIAHSMGGLDARYLISRLGLAERVRSLTTIATPHQGTYLADWFIANYRHRVPLLLALEAFGFNMDGFRDCRPAVCQEFNAATPNVPGVTYFSYGGAVPQSRVSPFLRRAWNLLLPVEGPNDGMVSVASAHWGEYLGTIEADHFAQTPDSMFLRPGEDFDSLGFCLRLVEDLAYRGF